MDNLNVKTMVTNQEPTGAVHPEPNAPQSSGLDDRMNQSANQPGEVHKLRIFLVVFVLIFLLGGSALAYFTDLKYKIPFFRPDISELSSLMYEKISQLDGADFALIYQLNIGSRDADAPLPVDPDKEKKYKYLLGAESFGTMDFISGEAFADVWGMFEEMLPDDFSAQFTFGGSGFSFAQREEKEKLPDIGASLSGEGKFGSMTMKVGAEARVVDDAMYYRIWDFPFIDITKGHQDEWIRMPLENNVMEFIPEYDEKQRKITEEFRVFIAQTQEFDILSFSSTGEIIDVQGQKSAIFDMQINADNIPTWLEAARKIAIENSTEDTFSFLKAEKDSFTAEEKEEMIKKINDALRNIKISVAINMNTGDLMQINVTARLIPPFGSKKFADKQFNSVVILEIYNHNNPSKIEAPEEFTDGEEIEREDLELSEEEYTDYKQMQRVKGIRKELAKYHLEHKKFPENLSDISRVNKDRNTNQPYVYSVVNGNYNLVYTMNNDVHPEETDSETDFFGFGSNLSKSRLSFGYNRITKVRDYWNAGQNTADRYSPIADQLKVLDNYSHSGKSNHQVIITAYQAKIVKNTKDRLEKYFKDNKKYPETLAELESEGGLKTYNFYYSTIPSGYVCEDLSTGNLCQYRLTDQGYELIVNFPLAFTEVDILAFNIINFNLLNTFVAGNNTFKSESDIKTNNSNVDTDGDGLSDTMEAFCHTDNSNVDTDGDGLSDTMEAFYHTDIANPDTDGDGYSDGSEIANGYNPLGEGKLQHKIPCS